MKDTKKTHNSKSYDMGITTRNLPKLTKTTRFILSEGCISTWSFLRNSGESYYVDDGEGDCHGLDPTCVEIFVLTGYRSI